MLKPKVNRRKFLVLGSAFSAGLFSPIPFKLLRSPAANQSISAAIPQPLTNPASIGFWQESSQMTNLQPVSWQSTSQSQPQPTANLIAADALAESDRAFLSQGAKVQIQGLRFAENVQSLDVYAHYPAGVDHDIQKVYVWGFKSAPIPSASAPVSFIVPVSQADGLTFSLVWHYRHPDGSLLGEQEEAIAHFDLNASNAAKLQRGVYLVAGRDSKTGQQPDWKNYQLQIIESDRDDQKHQLMQLSHPHAEPEIAAVPYLLVAIDYPTPHVGTSV